MKFYELNEKQKIRAMEFANECGDNYEELDYMFIGEALIYASEKVEL